jgi:transcriptional regulator with XRE-family HTH domain
VTKAEFAVRVRELRARRKLTQEALAEASDLAADTIRRLEYGSFNASLDTMNKLAKGLNLTTTQLMVDNYDEADDLAAMLRRLPETEKRLACAMMGTLFVHAAANR